ncbi:MAG TPA: 16S rRNA (uracil(1498)-N(3))-methyltransferase [candidate division Zixibacteria bacterium]|nr:16S rRNA (uracil(1498)-N(3))-methyltransferase [candidate division Zixibacteria bacterium]
MAVYYSGPENIENDSLTLSGSEAHHISRVMRLKKGDALCVVDGIGNCYRCEIDYLSRGKLICSVISRTRNFGEPSNFVTLAPGLSLGSKLDEIIQKGVELGISRFVPLITEKSKVKLDDPARLKRRLTRWNKVALAAMKQCERSVLPKISPPIRFELLFEQIENPGRMILFDTNGKKNLYDLKLDKGDFDITLIVGPESGFSRSEVEFAGENGAEIIALGKRVLRAENASPVISALVMHHLGEFR